MVDFRGANFSGGAIEQAADLDLVGIRAKMPARSRGSVTLLSYFRNSAIGPDLVVHAAGLYWLISPPRTRFRPAGLGTG